jgi:hypothetical protein
LYLEDGEDADHTSHSNLHFSQLAESCSAGLQTGCPDGLPALRNLVRP